MSNTRPEGPGPDDDHGADRRDVDPPYPQHFPAKVQRFRQLLADTIAKRILADRNRPPSTGEARQ
jgi:hypothetical protein